MAGPDFYRILGVSRSASPDEIKSAHRELVKTFHPDLFTTSVEKARANKKLQQINEAYATLSNASRRRQYDARLSKSTSVADGTSRATQRSSASAPPPLSVAMVWTDLTGRISKKLRQLKEAYRVVAEAERRRANSSKKPGNIRRTGSSRESTWARSFRSLSEIWRRSAKRWKHLVSPQVTAIIVGAILLLLIAVSLSAVLEETQTGTAWALLESTVNEPAQDTPQKYKWTALEQHKNAFECAESLKKRVGSDEQQGGKVFLDERGGTMAMAIYAKSESALTQEYLEAKLKGVPPDADRRLLEQQAREEAREFISKNGAAQRIKHYRCREFEWVKPDSWLRSQLKRLGLVA
jgi:curved DNA-binding protein CbpA